MHGALLLHLQHDSESKSRQFRVCLHHVPVLDAVSICSWCYAACLAASTALHTVVSSCMESV
jgi:hypothetical protein